MAAVEAKSFRCVQAVAEGGKHFEAVVPCRQMAQSAGFAAVLVMLMWMTPDSRHSAHTKPMATFG